MTDGLIPIKNAANVTENMRVDDQGGAGKLFYHKEDDTQRAALVSAITAISTALGLTLNVAGPLTSGQLASAGLATQTTQAAILATLQAQADLAATLWLDNNGAYWLRRDIIDQDSSTITVSFTDASGTAGTPGAGLRPAANEKSLHTEQQLYNATAGGTGYSIGDVIGRIVILNIDVTPPAVVTSTWLNLTTAAVISAPSSGNLSATGNSVVISSSALPAGAATEATIAAILATQPGSTARDAAGAAKPPVYLEKGFQRITALSSATALTVPGGTRYAVIQAEGQPVRWRSDGTNPTASVGMQIPLGGELTYDADLSAIKFIETAASAVLVVSYYA